MSRNFIFFLISLSLATAWSAEREPWTTNKIQGSPEPPLPYTTEVIWPHITFSEGLDISLLESEERLIISERKGKLFSLPADLNANPSEAKLVGDLRSFIPNLGAVYGLTFHPDFEKNKQLYIFYTISSRDEDTESRVSKFLMDTSLQLIPESQEILMTTGGGGHNGGDMHFGPDGMLYITWGDLAPPSPPDPDLVGQDMSTLASTLARVDVDHRDPGLAYSVPKDNPFINLPGVRPEIWAFGFRNPWKMSFHPSSGDIWLGDVGWEIWEMIYRVEKGGNYGWSIMEGPVPLIPDQPIGPAPISPPTAYYSHVEGVSVTGGYWVTSPRIPDLQGSYIYGDYVTGRVWALEWDGKSVTRNEQIADTRKQIVTFGQDMEGDLIFLTYPDNGQLHRFVPNTQVEQTSEFPKQLSETGLFANVKAEEPSPGVYPFSINAPTWQDGYESRYWVGLPGNGRIESVIAYRDELPLLRFNKPNNTVLAKTIHEDGKRIETQILHFDGYWHGYTYRWNDEQSDASLVRKEGLDTTVNGKPYRFPARNECARCHGSNFHRPQAFLPGQLNKEDQLDRFLQLGLINDNFKTMAGMQKLVNPYDENAAIDQRARSWIQTNCAFCHRVSGGAGVTSMFNAAVPTDRMRLKDFTPEKGTFGLEDGQLIDPGNPYNSIFYYRIATKGAGHMPMIPTKKMDTTGIQLVHDWIRSMDPKKEIPKASLNPQSVGEALALYHAIQSGDLSKAEADQAIANCMKSSLPFVINLFAGLTLD